MDWIKHTVIDGLFSYHAHLDDYVAIIFDHVDPKYRDNGKRYSWYLHAYANEDPTASGWTDTFLEAEQAIAKAMEGIE